MNTMKEWNDLVEDKFCPKCGQYYPNVLLSRFDEKTQTEFCFLSCPFCDNETSELTFEDLKGNHEYWDSDL